MIHRLKESVQGGICVIFYIIFMISLSASGKAVGQTTVLISPPTVTADKNASFSVVVRVENVTGLHGSKIIITFDPAVLQVQSVSRGAFLRSTGYSSFYSPSIDNINGKVQTDEAIFGQEVISGSGELAIITFLGINDGASTIAITTVDLRDLDNQPIAAVKQDGAVQIGQGGTLNQAPDVTGLPDQSIHAGESFSTIPLDDYVTDPDNIDSDLTWTYSGNNSLTVSITDRVATVTYQAGWTGLETITFRATDPGGLYDEDSAIFRVSAPVNQPPVVSDIPDQSILLGGSFSQISLDFYVNDPDNTDTELNWTYSGSSSLTVSITDRVATITPQSGWTGSETITFRATDPGGLYDEDSVTFTVGIQTNQPPVVSDIPDQTIPLGGNFSQISLDFFVNDPDNNDKELNWTYSGNSSLTVSIVNHIATITPQTGWTGSETITFRATDPGGLYNEDNVTFYVTNQHPVVSDIPDQTIRLGEKFSQISLDFFVTDPDNTDEELCWTYSGNSSLTISIVDHVATITPQTGWTGSETITFRATDPGGLYDEDSVTFYVTNQPPVVSDIPDQTIQPGGSFEKIPLDDYVTDPDNTDKELSWTYSGNSSLTVSIVNHVATITPQTGWTGSETITFRATDPVGLYDEDSVVFTINASTQLEGIDAIDSYPNPFNPLEGAMTIRYRFSKDCIISISIFDNSNTLVGTPKRLENCLKDVHYTCEWNGKNDDGMMVANGVYYFVIQSNAGDRVVWKALVVY